MEHDDMATQYHGGRALAILCGVAATGGALTILLADPITTGNWRLDHVLLPLIVTITIALGHLCGSALRQWKILPALGFLALFMGGTILTVYSSVGAQKSGAGARQDVAVASHNEAITKKRADLDRARLRYDQANKEADREMTGSRCGPRCNDWKLRAKEVAAHIAQIERDIKGLGAPKVAPSRARPFAEAMGVLGFDAAKVEKIAATFEPFAFSLLFELTAIVAFGFGFGHRPIAKAAALSAPRQIALSPVDDDSPPGGTSKIEALADLLTLHKAGQDAPSQDWLAARWGRSKSTVHRWLGEWEHSNLIRKDRVGKEKMISAA